MAHELGSLYAETETLNHVLRLVEAFRAFDADNDGQITAEELTGLMGSLGYNPTEQDISAMMQKGDANRDGMLSISEFLDMNTEELELAGGLGDSLKRAFDVMDFDGGDFLTGEELYEVMVNMEIIGLSLEDCQNVIAAMDVDGDGAVSSEDFKLIVKCLV